MHFAYTTTNNVLPPHFDCIPMLVSHKCKIGLKGPPDTSPVWMGESSKLGRYVYSQLPPVRLIALNTGDPRFS